VVAAICRRDRARRRFNELKVIKEITKVEFTVNKGFNRDPGVDADVSARDFFYVWR
jgi:hypothetical protein